MSKELYAVVICSAGDNNILFFSTDREKAINVLDNTPGIDTGYVCLYELDGKVDLFKGKPPVIKDKGFVTISPAGVYMS